MRFCLNTWCFIGLNCGIAFLAHGLQKETESEPATAIWPDTLAIITSAPVAAEAKAKTTRHDKEASLLFQNHMLSLVLAWNSLPWGWYACKLLLFFWSAKSYTLVANTVLPGACSLTVERILFGFEFFYALPFWLRKTLCADLRRLGSVPQSGWSRSLLHSCFVRWATLHKDLPQITSFSLVIWCSCAWLRLKGSCFYNWYHWCVFCERMTRCHRHMLPMCFYLNAPALPKPSASRSPSFTSVVAFHAAKYSFFQHFWIVCSFLI